MTPTAVAAAPAPAPREASQAPNRAPIVLLALILTAAVANLNLAVANVALPSIGQAFGASQTALDLVAVGYSLGLAASVLYLGAVGDRYGRKLMLLGGLILSVPACLAASFAPNIWFLVGARIVGGLSAGMAYPTTLALITALWIGPGRTKAIALWSGIGGAISALGPLASGWILTYFSWGSVFFLTLPLAAIAIPLAWWVIPSHVNESTEPVDNIGGLLSIVMIAALVAAINFLPVPGATKFALLLGFLATAAGIAFIWRQRRAANPLYDLQVAKRRIFWVAATAGIIVFGTLMGAMLVGQQFLQDVLGYSTLSSGLSILPAAVGMIVAAPVSARIVNARGARVTLLLGYVFCLSGFAVMLSMWKDGIPYWPVGLAYGLVGIGVGLAGTPASHSLTGSVPVDRAGMASGTADLQRDLGGAIMQSILGALLAIGYSTSVSNAISAAPQSTQEKITSSIANSLEMSYSGAMSVAKQYPQYSSQITAAAKTAFLQGADLAYIAGGLAIIVGAILVFVAFPRFDEEEALLKQYAEQDAARTA